KLPEVAKRVASVGVGLGKVRLERDRPVIAGNRHLKSREGAEHITAIGVGFGIVRPERDRPVIAGNRRLKLREALECGTAIGVTSGIRSNLDRSINQTKRGLVVVCL